jgi:hypothetical protein
MLEVAAAYVQLASRYHSGVGFIPLVIEDLGEILVPGLLEPRDRLLLGDALPLANLALAQLALGDAVPSALHHNVEIHTVDTRVRIVLDTEIDMLADAETPVACKLQVSNFSAW